MDDIPLFLQKKVFVDGLIPSLKKLAFQLWVSKCGKEVEHLLIRNNSTTAVVCVLTMVCCIRQNLMTQNGHCISSFKSVVDLTLLGGSSLVLPGVSHVFESRCQLRMEIHWGDFTHVSSSWLSPWGSRKEDKYAASPIKSQTLSCDTSSWAKAVEKDSISWCVEEQDHTGRTGVVRVVTRKIDLHAAFFSSLYSQFFLIILENYEPSLPSPFGSCSMNVTKII